MRHHAGQNLDRIGLLPLARKARLAGAAAVEVVLDVLDGERQQRRAAVDHAADRDPVTFAEGRDPEHVAEGAEGILRTIRIAVDRQPRPCRNARGCGGQTTRVKPRWRGMCSAPPPPLAGEGWGGGTLAPVFAAAPTPALPRRKSGLPDLRKIQDTQPG